jgi:hypothetical protein
MSITFTAQWGTGDDTKSGEEINLANGNAAAVLALLGYGEPAGSYEVLGIQFPVIPAAAGDAEPDDFIGRILIARGLLDIATDDEHGKPMTGNGGGPGTGRALIIDCGRHPGGLAERLSDLEAVARDAKTHGGIVTWG